MGILLEPRLSNPVCQPLKSGPSRLRHGKPREDVRFAQSVRRVFSPPGTPGRAYVLSYARHLNI